ncbi:MAG: hypothetical protein PVF42_04735 [Desulfobacterales bacterium]|jgi:flavodoxin
MNKKKVFIVYFSPAGSTRHIAEIIEKRFKELGAEVSSFDLAQSSNEVAISISQQMEALSGECCLFIGSPVYVSHAVPLVMNCITKLKESNGAFAVPFVTWGGACSGIALYEMGKELINKKFTLLGAAKILGVHSLMWQLEDPLGKGHPDADDDRMVEELVELNCLIWLIRANKIMQRWKKSVFKLPKRICRNEPSIPSFAINVRSVQMYVRQML